MSLLLAAIAIASPASGDSAEMLESAGRYREAEPLLRRAVDAAGRRDSDALADASGSLKIWPGKRERWRQNRSIVGPSRSA